MGCVCVSAKDKQHSALTPSISFCLYVAPPDMGRMIARNKKSHTQCSSSNTHIKKNYLLNKHELVPWHPVGRSFHPSGSAFSLASRHARAPRVTDYGRTWQSCAMPGHLGQSSMPARRKEGNVGVLRNQPFSFRRSKRNIPQLPRC